MSDQERLDALDIYDEHAGLRAISPAKVLALVEHERSEACKAIRDYGGNGAAAILEILALRGELREMKAQRDNLVAQYDGPTVSQLVTDNTQLTEQVVAAQAALARETERAEKLENEVQSLTNVNLSIVAGRTLVEAALARETERAERAEKRLEEAERLLHDWTDNQVDAWQTVNARTRAFLAAHEPNSPGDPTVEPFVVRHYTGTERPIIKGNGFDGLEVGKDREEAEKFVAWLNAKIGSLG